MCLNPFIIIYTVAENPTYNKQKSMTRQQHIGHLIWKYRHILFLNYESFLGKWANPWGTAIQGQLLIEPEQAPDIPSPFKNKFNIEEDT